MPAVVRTNDLCSGHPTFPPRACLVGSPDVFVNGRPLVRAGDEWLPHTNGISLHAGHVTDGAPNVYCNGKAVVRVGDGIRAGCLSQAAHGSPDVFCGNA